MTKPLLLNKGRLIEQSINISTFCWPKSCVRAQDLHHVCWALLFSCSTYACIRSMSWRKTMHMQAKTASAGAFKIGSYAKIDHFLAT
jgi:hypothetical protein